jgi:hypothetical protein
MLFWHKRAAAAYKSMCGLYWIQDFADKDALLNPGKTAGIIEQSRKPDE